MEIRAKPRTWTTSCTLRLSMPPSQRHLSSGPLEVLRQSMFSSLNQAFENAKEHQCHQAVACVEEDKVRLARSSIMANGSVISSQILSSVLPFGILHADIHDLVVKSHRSPSERRQPSPSPRRCHPRSSTGKRLKCHHPCHRSTSCAAPLENTA